MHLLIYRDKDEMINILYYKHGTSNKEKIWVPERNGILDLSSKHKAGALSTELWELMVLGRSWVQFPPGAQIFLFVPCSRHVDHLDHISLPSLKFTIISFIINNYLLLLILLDSLETISIWVKVDCFSSVIQKHKGQGNKVGKKAWW